MPLKLHKRGKVWHYRGTVAGRLLRRSTRSQNKEIAQRLAAEREAREWKGRLDGPGAVLTFAQAAILYTKAQKPLRFLDRVEDHWQETPVKDITAGAVRQAAIELYPDCGPATRNRQVIVPTQAIINHAAELELCPRLRVKRFPVVRVEKEPATWPWVRTFMLHARPNLGALACFMFLTGARVGEAVALTWEDLDLEAAKATIRSTKIGLERRAHLPPELVAAISVIRKAKNPFNARPANDRVFGYLSRDTARPPWDRAVRRAGLKPLSFHACRHGFATGLLQAGVNPKTVAKRGGWKSTAHVFATYGHDLSDENITDVLTGTKAAQLEYESPRTPKKSMA